MYKKKETSNREIALTILAIIIATALTVGLFAYAILSTRDVFIDFASYLGTEAKVEQVCLDNGYSDYNVTETQEGLQGYCIRLVDGTTETVNIKDLPQ